MRDSISNTISDERLTNIKEPIRLTYDCIPCAIGSLITLIKKNLVPAEKQPAAMGHLLRYLSDVNFNQSPPALGREMHRMIRQIIENPDPYRQIKAEFNSLMLALYPALKQEVLNAADSFLMALRLAIAGNIIDFGPNHAFDVQETIQKAKSVKLAIDHSARLREDIVKSKKILYLGDNAGEIVMDRLFLETIQHPNVFFAVRGAPIINDVTIEDAHQVGIAQVAKIISNGDDAPGTILDGVSTEFLTLFHEADLIISKGQGNYESLSDSHQKIYFLLMTKCEHVANHVGVHKGDFVVLGRN
ncbi:DUF89 family protein [candidate division KSB1 bacterium]|nr:DUF89 family protein [candidate division KSB1 bacterium]